MEPSAVASGAPDLVRAPSTELMRGLVRAALTMSGELDQRTLLSTAVDSTMQLMDASGGSFWAVDGDTAICQLATGNGAGALRGSTVSVVSLSSTQGVVAAITAPVITGGQTIGFLRATRDRLRNDQSPIDEAPPSAFDASDIEALALLAESTASALQLAAHLKANDRSGDLKLVQELSREIGSSLDLDRVLKTVVNIAARALSFDLGALALYEGGTCDIRAVAGASAVDSSAEDMQDLAFRAAWAAGTGEMFYLSDREAPGTDTERIFLQFFDAELAKVGMNSGLYLPLRDEEGIVGILLLEANRVEFAGARERELASILANQATVAIRNAKLYSQVPLAEALGALSAKRAAFFSIPRRRRTTAFVIAIAVLAAVSLIRWPLRVMAEGPVFKPTDFLAVRPVNSGTVDQILVREGAEVATGDPIARLRDVEARAARTQAEAALRSATRAAAMAASRGDAAEQRLQQTLEESARADLALRADELGMQTVRAPGPGVVLTSRPELLVNAHLSAGEVFVIIGRTDTLELEFGVDERDIARVHSGDEVRLRLDALPQQTFVGRVTFIGPLPTAQVGPQLQPVLYPVRARVPNPEGTLRPGMAAQARVLTVPASLAGRLLITPIRTIRLWWWRTWSWL